MTFFNSPVNAQEYINLGDVVSVDGFYAMNRMTSYIIKNKGCTKLAYIGYAEGSRMIQARYLGYLNACNQNYIGVDEKMQFTHPANHINFSYAMVEEAMNQMMGAAATSMSVMLARKTDISTPETKFMEDGAVSGI